MDQLFGPKNKANDAENFSTYPKNFSALTLTTENFSGKFFRRKCSTPGGLKGRLQLGKAPKWRIV
jgi:hypothetical protein